MMGYPARSERSSASRLATIAIVALAAAVVVAVWSSQPVAAVSLVGKDGRIHACYKAKGKAKGTLRVVRGAKVRCPRGWKKVAWNTSGSAGGGGENGGPGEPGQPGSGGANGGNGAAGVNGKVSSLEAKVTELLAKLKSLEGILAGVTNADLKGALGTVPVVAALCGQAGQLSSQTASLGSAMGSLTTVLAVAFPLLDLPPVPASLPPFSCP